MVALTIGGMLNAAIGWRMTAVALGTPGLILAVVMMLSTREPRRGGSEAQSVDVRRYDLCHAAGR
jgi:predicted MFS family arabinose efflux permease